MARMVAMLDDDETLVPIPPGPFYSLDAEWFGTTVILIGVPAADRDLLGGQRVAIDGHPIGAVMAEIAPLILPGVAHPPLPLYLENITMPYGLRVLPTQRAVFLKYNSCVGAFQYSNWRCTPSPCSGNTPATS